MTPILTTLQNIQETLRLITHSPSIAQLTDSQANNYINKFLLYNLPNELRLFSLRTTLNFYTQPGVDVYATNTTDPLDPLYDFQNNYITVHPQMFIAGIPVTYTQYRNVFYGRWPQTNAVINTGQAGNGTIGPFSGIVNSAVVANPPPIPSQPQILQNSLIFTCLATTGQSMILVDYPQGNLTGLLGIPNQPDILTNPYGSINYLTGEYSFNFPANTLVSSPILPNPVWVEYVPYVAGKPIDILFYDNKFTIRPVPDKTYLVQLEVDARPTALLNTAQNPMINQWADFIALGAARLVFRDRGDKASYNDQAEPYREQMNNVNRTSLCQQTDMRSQTIFVVGRANTWGWMGSNWPY